MDNAELTIFLLTLYSIGCIIIGTGLFQYLINNNLIEENFANFLAVIVFWPIVMLILIIKLSLQVLKSLFIIIKDILINKKDTDK